MFKVTLSCLNKGKHFEIKGKCLFHCICVKAAVSEGPDAKPAPFKSSKTERALSYSGQRERCGWWNGALKPATGQPKLCGWFEPHSPVYTFSISGGKLGFLSVWSTIFWLYGVENRIQFLFNTSSLTDHQMWHFLSHKKCWYQRTLATAFPCFFKTFGVRWFTESIWLWKSALKH